jgi:hypothetical protein
MKSRTFTTLDWKKYLDPNNNVRVARFLEKRGYEVMNQVSTNIYKEKEEYEMCAKIVKYKQDILNFRKPIQKKKEVRKLI